MNARRVLAAIAALLAAIVLVLLLWPGATVRSAKPGDAGAHAAAVARTRAAAHRNGGAAPAAPAPRSTGAVRGRVIDGGSSAPVAGATVTLLRGDKEVSVSSSGADGAFSFEPGSADSVSVTARGYALCLKPLPRGGDVTVRLDAGVVVRGRVLDDAGTGIGGATVWIEDVEGEAWERDDPGVSSNVLSGADGSFEISDSPSGRLVAYASDVAHARGEKEIGPTGPGRTANVVIRLYEGATISGRLSAADGRSVAGATVRWIERFDSSLDEPATGAVVAPDGSYRLEHLRNGRGTVAATDGRGVAGAAASAESGRETKVDLVLSADREVHGRVLDESGSPVAHARIDASTYDVSSRSEGAARFLARELRDRAPPESGADGRFTIGGIPPDTNSIEISASLGDARALAEVSGEAAEQEVVLTMVATASLDGTVVGSDGAPSDVAGQARLSSSEGSVRVSNGEFHFSHVFVGDATVTLEIPGYADAEKEVALSAGENRVSVALAAPAARIRGSLAGPDGAPVRGARVSLSLAPRDELRGGSGGSLDWRASVRSDAAGRFELPAPAGEMRLFVYHPEFQPALVPVTVPPGVREADAGTIQLHTGEGKSAAFEFSGIGAALSFESGHVMVKKVFPGSPAERAGVRDEDVLASIDGVATDGLELPDVVERIRGPVGTTVSLVLVRKGNPAPLTVDVIREKIQA